MRGENKQPTDSRNEEDGTSPRARGKPAITPSSTAHDRNIPACAGKTSQLSRLVSAMAEHPRVRGENAVHGEVDFRLYGTSPRARGKRIDLLSRGVEQRNIPACAGKTQTVPCKSPQHPEHPRVRGENSSRL